ncbi:MAG: glycosyltransferase [Defluviitaleaceae bacterium]|nr:glycosyltransferase [Defluviitaleaceae bacterium]
MRDILIVTNTMGRAGAETALISLLGRLDYTRARVSLLAIIPRGEMFARLPSEVIRLNRRVSQKPVLGIFAAISLASLIIWRLIRHLQYLPYMAKNAFMQIRRGKLRLDKLFWLLLAKTTPPQKARYDLAIAFMEGAATYYVAERAQAAKKLAFVHVNYEKAGYLKELDLPFYQKMDFVCPVSQSLKTALCQIFPNMTDKIFVFPNIVDIAGIRARAGQGVGFDDDFGGIRILTIARLHPQKGIDAAIAAFAQINRPNIKWYIVGEGTQRRKLEKLIQKHKLEGRFVLLGAKENPMPYISQADIYIQPSRYEGFCLALLEAIILGKACIATDFDGLPDLLENNTDAIIIPFGAKNIAKALSDLIENSSRRAELAKAAAAKNISFDDMTETLYKI